MLRYRSEWLGKIAEAGVRRRAELELTADCEQITGNSKAIRFSENRNEKAAFKQADSLASKLWGRPLRPRQL
jgi:hypothetical protein